MIRAPSSNGAAADGLVDPEADDPCAPASGPDAPAPTPPAVARANAARDKQLSIAMHELRTPISTILLNLQLLERRATRDGSVDAATVQRLLDVPKRQLRRLTCMVGLLLDAAQVESDRLVLRREPLDLRELVQDAAARLKEVARAHGARLLVADGPPVRGAWDRLRLEQVLTNLLVNAIKYGNGSTVTASATLRPDSAVAELSVRDGGIGIATEDLSRIFEPFERVGPGRDRDGAGLGLYIVREIVVAHGGSVAVESAPGAGSCFTVRLPIVPGASPGGHARAQEQQETP